jgi:hypothetical protein
MNSRGNTQRLPFYCKCNMAVSYGTSGRDDCHVRLIKSETMMRGGVTLNTDFEQRSIILRLTSVSHHVYWTPILQKPQPIDLKYLTSCCYKSVLMLSHNVLPKFPLPKDLSSWFNPTTSPTPHCTFSPIIIIIIIITFLHVSALTTADLYKLPSSALGYVQFFTLQGAC